MIIIQEDPLIIWRCPRNRYHAWSGSRWIECDKCRRDHLLAAGGGAGGRAGYDTTEGKLMGEFEVGDTVEIPGVPITVEVLEIADRDGERCFRFDDPGGLGDDWMPVDQFRRVHR